MHYTENLYRLVSANLFEQIRLSHKSFKLETLKDIRGDIVRFYIPHTHIFVVQSAPKFIPQHAPLYHIEIDTQRSHTYTHTCSYFHLDLVARQALFVRQPLDYARAAHVQIAMGTHVPLRSALFPTILFQIVYLPAQSGNNIKKFF